MSLPLPSYTALYQQITGFVQQHGFCTPLPPPAVGAAAPPYETLQALLGACHTSATKRNHRHLLAQPAQRLARYEQGATIAALAAELHLPPTKVARDLLEGLLDVRRSGVRELLRGAPAAILRCQLRSDCAARLAQRHGSAPPQQLHWQLLARLAAEVAHCVACDLKDSPLLDDVREWSGEEHEWRLAASLCALGIPPAAMLTEEELRHGAQRRSTPDILLRWPIAIPCPHAPPPALRLVSWLDSKASFADPLALDDSSMGIGRQVNKYLADFGPGMVVFWGGWVDSLAAGAGGGFGGGLVLHHRPPRAWRWATEEEKAAADAFKEQRQEEELGAGVAGGGGGGAAAGGAQGAQQQPGGQQPLLWDAMPVAVPAPAAAPQQALAPAGLAAAHQDRLQAMLRGEEAML